MSDMECPYCGADQEVCHDDGHGYAEGVAHEHTCSQCKKVFVFQTSISFYYEPSKADCLNGGEHALKFARHYPERYSMMRCKDCDYQRKPTPNEFKAAGIDVAVTQ